MDVVLESSDGSEALNDFSSFRVEKLDQTRSRVALQEAFALLTICSLFIINEAGIRLINTNPASDLLSGHPPNVLLFVGSALELIEGLVGLFLGINGFVCKKHSVLVTKFSLGIQAFISVFVIVIYVFVVPTVHSVQGPSFEGMSSGENRVLISFGILTSFHFSLALHGALIVLAARLIALDTNQNFMWQRSRTRLFAIVWNGNLGFAGLWTVITGLFIRTHVGPGLLDQPFRSSLNFGRLPGLTVLMGVVLMLLAVLGVIIVLAKARLPAFYLPAVSFVYVLGLLNYSVIQLGLIEKAPASDVALNAGSVFMLVFLGPYFVLLTIRSNEERGLLV